MRLKSRKELEGRYLISYYIRDWDLFLQMCSTVEIAAVMRFAHVFHISAAPAVATRIYRFSKSEEPLAVSCAENLQRGSDGGDLLKATLCSK